MTGICRVLLSVVALAAALASAACGDAHVFNQPTTCQPISTTELFGSFAQYANSELCFEGAIHYIHGEPYIVPGEWAQEEPFDFAIPIDPDSDIARFGDLLSGDLANFEGFLFTSDECLERLEGRKDLISQICDDRLFNRFEPTTITVTSRAVSNERCLEVPIAELYASPLDYNEQVICTSGYVLVEDVQSTHVRTAIVPDGFDIATLETISIEIRDTTHNIELIRVRLGDRVRARGRFGVSEGCYQQYLGEEMGGDEWFCFPIAAPLWLMNPEFEVIN